MAAVLGGGDVLPLSSLNKTEQNLVKASMKVMGNAYQPYSNFPVGAAVLTVSNRVYEGCCMDNTIYGLSTCAERAAIVNAVSEGEKSIKAISIVSKLDDTFITPCGGCRQIISEFGHDNDCCVILVKRSGRECLKTSIKQLLPNAFTPNVLLQ